MNQLERMQIRLDKHREKRARGRPRKEVVVVPQPMPAPMRIPEPERKTFTAINGTRLEHFNLEGGQNLDVGDVFWSNRKFVIKKITKTVGDNTVQVEAELTKDMWANPSPFRTF